MRGLLMTREQYEAHQRSVARARLVERSAEARTERVEDARKAAGIKAPNLNKYHNEPTVAHGRKFQSKREAHRHGELLLEQRAGSITDLECQRRYQIRVNGEVVCTYIADFVYKRDGLVCVEDSKGVKTDVYILKRKLMKIVNGIEIPGGLMSSARMVSEWFKRVGLAVSQYPPPVHQCTIAAIDSMSALDDSFDVAYGKAVKEIELADVTHDGIAAAAAVDEFSRVTGRAVLDWGSEEHDITRIGDVVQRTLRQGYIRFAPVAEEV